MKTPNIRPKDLSIDPTPVHVTARPMDLPKTIKKKSVKTKITKPKPTLLTKSDLCIYLLSVEI